jgi:hypothetical protein
MRRFSHPLYDSGEEEDPLEDHSPEWDSRWAPGPDADAECGAGSHLAWTPSATPVPGFIETRREETRSCPWSLDTARTDTAEPATMIVGPAVDNCLS